MNLFKKKIEKLSNYELLEMYEREIKRSHYDPCDNYERLPYDSGEIRNEIVRRMGGYL